MFLVGYDFSNPFVSNKISILSTNNKLNIGNLLVCNQLDEYVLVNYNGSSKLITGNFFHDFSTSPLSINFLGTPTTMFQMSFDPISTNEATMKSLSFAYDNGGSTIENLSCNFCSSCDCNDNDKLNLNTVPKPGDYT